MTCDQSYSQSHVGSGSKGRFVMYTDADGLWALKLGGSKSWRNNNPGNLRYGTFAKNHGAIGRDKDGMAIFSDVATGAAAKKSLITGPVYNNGDMSIHDFINKYAPPSENDTVAYEAYIKKQLEITDTSTTKINDVNIDELLDVLKRREGWIPGTEESGLPTDQCAEPPPPPQPTSNIDDIKKKVKKASVTKSPIALDLNGDGITTTALTAGAYFDHDGNGFAEQTGWVNSEDGILVRDLDGNGTIDNGRELFGSETLLANGQKAANGYAALAELDTNHDGQINVQDAAYSTLKIWKDIDGDGYSSEGELLTLAEAGVQSIATGYATVNQTDANGNITQQTSTFTKTDGSTGNTGTPQGMADINLAADTYHRTFSDTIPTTAQTETLPDMQGSGLVRDLREAASMQTAEGQALAAKLTQFAQASTRSEQMAQLDDLLAAWGNTSGFGDMRTRAQAHGYTLNVAHLSSTQEKQLNVLEQFNGRSFYKWPWEVAANDASFYLFERRVA